MSHTILTNSSADGAGLARAVWPSLTRAGIEVWYDKKHLPVEAPGGPGRRRWTSPSGRAAE